jgi:hypothetical protein
MPRGIETDEYVRRYKKHLSPVKHLLGEGMGLRLQREDSDLALTVLDTLAKDKIVALPVHDSFIVKARHKHILTITMYNAFNRLYGYEAIVK